MLPMTNSRNTHVVDASCSLASITAAKSASGPPRSAIATIVMLVSSTPK